MSQRIPASVEAPTDVLEPVVPPSIAAGRLFLLFSRVALSGFGGVMPFAYRALVERERLLTSEEFAQLLALSQVLPGPTICNLSIMTGWRFGGVKGASAALLGMLAGPFCIVLLLGYGYRYWGQSPLVRNALLGMSAVAAGLVAGTAAKMAIALFRVRRAHSQTIFLSAIVAAAFLGVGLFSYPLIVVVAALAPVSVALFLWMPDDAR